MPLGFSPISILPIATLPYWSGYVWTSSVLTFEVFGTTLFAATVPFISLPTDAPANQPFEGTLEATLRIDRSIIGSDGYGGFAETISELSLINVDGEYDDLATEVSINAQPILASMGTVSINGVVDAYATFEPFAELIAERLNLSRTRCIIETRDRALTLSNKTVQQSTYAGTGELEGGTDLAAKRRPFADGMVFNVSPVLVIAGELLFQCNDGAVASIDTVKDGGASLTFADDYASVALLRAATLAPAYYASCVAEGYFRLGGTSFNQVTADVSGLRLTTADIILNVAQTSASQSADQIDQASFDQLNEDQPAVVGYYLGPESNETCADMFRALMTGIGGWFGISLSGKLQVRRFALPDTFASANYTQVFSNVTPVATYTGPGNVVTGALAWWGLRAYSEASIGANAVRLREDGGNTEQNFATIAGGGLDLAAIATFKGGNNLFVTKLYDQVGTNHLLQATAGNQPKFTLSAIGALPALEGDAVRALFSTSNIVQAQPLTASAVAYHVGAGGRDYLFGTAGANSWSGGFDFFAANKIFVDAGAGPIDITATDDTWCAIQFVFNGASSDVNIDGTPNSASPGTEGAGASSMCVLGNFGLSEMNGFLGEFGVWAGAFNSTQSSNMSANQHAYWVF